MTAQQLTDRRPIADVFRTLAAAPVRWCVALGVHPNTISIASVVVSLLAGICFAFGLVSHWFCVLGVALCFFRLYLNMLDGMVAIAAKKVTATGEIANEFPDRLSDVFIFVGAAHGFMSLPYLGYWCAILSLLVAYVGTLGKASGAHRDFSGPMSKPWRVVLLCGGVIATAIQFAQPYAPAMVMAPIACLDFVCLVIAIGCVITIIRRLARIITVLK